MATGWCMRRAPENSAVSCTVFVGRQLTDCVYHVTRLKLDLCREHGTRNRILQRSTRRRSRHRSTTVCRTRREFIVSRTTQIYYTAQHTQRCIIPFCACSPQEPRYDSKKRQTQPRQNSTPSVMAVDMTLARRYVCVL